MTAPNFSKMVLFGGVSKKSKLSFLLLFSDSCPELSCCCYFVADTNRLFLEALAFSMKSFNYGVTPVMTGNVSIDVRLAAWRSDKFLSGPRSPAGYEFFKAFSMIILGRKKSEAVLSRRSSCWGSVPDHGTSSTKIFFVGYSKRPCLLLVFEFLRSDISWS